MDIFRRQELIHYITDSRKENFRETLLGYLAEHFP